MYLRVLEELRFSKTLIFYASVINEEDLLVICWSSKSIWGCRRAKSLWRRWTSCLRVVRSNSSVSTCLRNCCRIEYITIAGDSVEYLSIGGAWVGKVNSSGNPNNPGKKITRFQQTSKIKSLDKIEIKN